MRLVFNGKHTVTQGKAPKKRLKWTGTVTVSGPTGAAIEVPWQTHNGQPLTYAEAKDAIWRACRMSEEAYFEAYNSQADHVTFMLECR